MGLTQQERDMLGESVARFIVERYDPKQRRRLASSDDGFGRQEWNAYAALGWLGATLPAAQGGAGGGTVDLMIIMEAVGRGLLLEPILACVVLAGRLIEVAGTQWQREQLLPTIAEGQLILAFAHSEADSGYCRAWIKATACTDAGDGYCLTGKKVGVMHGAAADQLVVSARVKNDNGAVGLFLVDRRAPGVTVSSCRGIDDRPMASVVLERVMVARSQRLGFEDAQPLIEAVLDRATLCACAEALGAIRICNSMTVEHLKMRRQFGRSLSTFQALRHRVVDMAIAEAEVRAVVASAAEALDRGSQQAPQMISAAKVKTGRAAKLVGEQAIQLHGAIGMTNELVVGDYYKRLLSFESAFGDADWHLQRLGALPDIYPGVPAN